jgi:hypothetical protein
MPLFTFAACITAVVAVLAAWALYKENRHLQRRIAGLTRPRTAPPFVPPAAPKTPEQERAERLDRQLEAVTREAVKFFTSQIMGRGEYELFRAALRVTRQPLPTAFYVFPQVALGQIIRTAAPFNWQADHAHRAINSKRCDLLITDRHGNPVAVLEYQGSGHDLGGTATRRDEIKRMALERAGVRYVEIVDGMAPGEMQRIIRNLLAEQQSPPPKAAASQTPA